MENWTNEKYTEEALALIRRANIAWSGGEMIGAQFVSLLPEVKYGLLYSILRSPFFTRNKEIEVVIKVIGKATSADEKSGYKFHWVIDRDHHMQFTIEPFETRPLPRGFYLFCARYKDSNGLEWYLVPWEAVSALMTEGRYITIYQPQVRQFRLPAPGSESLLNSLIEPIRPSRTTHRHSRKQKMSKCRLCNKMVRLTWKYCPWCGTPLRVGM